MTEALGGQDCGAREATWLEELVGYAEGNPQHWAVMPLLLEKNSKRYGLHVWWDTTEVQPSDPACGLSGMSVFYAKFDNDALLEPVHSLPSLLAGKLAAKPLLFLEDHCVLARTACFSSTQPLFDPRACYRREFFDLAWQIRARGGDVGMALRSVVVYEKVQPLQLEDLPYFLHRRQDELCFMSQEYLAHKWRIRYRTDCWHEAQRSDALRGIFLGAVPANFNTTLTLVVSFLVMTGANRFCATTGCGPPSLAASWQNMEELLTKGFSPTPQRLLLHFQQVRLEKVLFESPPERVSIVHLRGVERLQRSEAVWTASPPEVSAYCDSTIFRLTLVLPPCEKPSTPGDAAASPHMSMNALEERYLKLLGLCSLVLQFEKLDDHTGDALEAYLWIREDVAKEEALLAIMRAHVHTALDGSALSCVVQRASEIALSRGSAGKVVCLRYLPVTLKQTRDMCGV
jgi:hypothetical protein